VKSGGSAAITADVAPGAFVNGNPAIPLMLERRIAVLKQRLPDSVQAGRELEEQVAGADKSLPPEGRRRNMPPP
jgi:hypothetical protein